MQTKKKPSTRNGAREHASPRFCRQQKKVHEHVHMAEKKVTELITSSARKQRFVQVSTGLIPKKTSDAKAAKDLNATYFLAADEAQSLCLSYDADGRDSVNHKGCAEKTAQCVLETLFSPAYHISKDGGAVHSRVDFIDYFRSEDHIDKQDRRSADLHNDALNRSAALETHDALGWKFPSQSPVADEFATVSADEFATVSHNALEENVGGKLCASETSSIYLEMQNTALECVDEPCQDSVTTEVYVEADDDEMDDFDPYLFIKNLPHLSVVVPTLRPMLLPKQTRSCPPTTLVLDLDETLVHSTLERCDDADFTFPVHFNLQVHTVYVRCRPYLRDFMERVASLFEIIVFTASQSIYAEQLLNVLDPKRKVIRHRVYRDSCVFVEGNYLKDLTVLGRDLARVAIIDNSPQAFGFQVDNGIPIESWFDDRSDDALCSLLPFLESLVGVEDVRPLIVKKFNLRQKIAAAADPSHNANRGDPFDRKI